MDSKLKCVFEEGSADASPKVCRMCNYMHIAYLYLFHFVNKNFEF